MNRATRICRGATSVRRQLLSKLSHVDPVTSTPQMVDVSAKESTVRYAHAQAIVLLPAILTRMLTSKQSNNPDYNKGVDNTESEIHTVKGPVFTTAIIAGVMAAKRTPDLIPFCHSLSLEDCQVKIRVMPSVSNVMKDNVDYSIISRSDGDSNSPIISAHHSEDLLTRLSVDCMVKTTGKTGVEMEAMVGASAAALCIYDMLKAVSHEIEIAQVRLISKSGGKNTYAALSS